MTTCRVEPLQIRDRLDLRYTEFVSSGYAATDGELGK